jgi:hypothetical protein
VQLRVTLVAHSLARSFAHQVAGGLDADG